MYCSTCGASIPTGRRACDTCGSAVAYPLERSGESPSPVGSQVQTETVPVAVCPRCGYHGEGLPYFTRGPHVAALVGATLFTLPYALGAGGFIYYGLRHDHRICPRCGSGWGRRAERALQTEPHGKIAGRPPVAARGSEGVKRIWSILLFGLAAVLLTVGVTQTEAVVVVLALIAGAGGFLLHRSYLRDRDARREALLAALQMPVLKLASERNGRLTVTEVAASLGWPLRRAEKVLHSLDDGWRVNSEVTDEGVIVYEFLELIRRPELPADPPS